MYGISWVILITACVCVCVCVYMCVCKHIILCQYSQQVILSVYTILCFFMVFDCNIIMHKLCRYVYNSLGHHVCAFLWSRSSGEKVR